MEKAINILCKNRAFIKVILTVKFSTLTRRNNCENAPDPVLEDLEHVTLN